MSSTDGTPSRSSLYDITAQRLAAYGLFSEATIAAVSAVAQRQAEYATYQDFFKEVGVPTPKLHHTSKKQSVPYIEIAAKKKQVGTLVVHLPMANPLDENQLYHIATVAAVLPRYRIIAFGNPSGPPYAFSQQTVRAWQLPAIALSKNRRSLVAAEIDYLRTHQITDASHIGYSYGAHKAVIEAGYLTDKEVASVICIDPVAHPRGIRQLVHDFRATFTPMGKYVDRTNIPSYFDARRAAARTSHHKTALRRPISIAIGLLMARFDFMAYLKNLMIIRPGLSVTIAWGTASELGNDAHMKVSIHELRHTHPGRVAAFRLQGDTHAFANDIHLYAALVHEALSS